MKTFLFTPLLALVLSPLALVAQTFSSGPQQVSLVELYTSEGCSSCPPAEARLSAMRSDSDLWKTFVPVAFHVTYWDNLGWADATAQAAFTARQQALAASWHTSSIYTPCFVRDGKEWRSAEKIAASHEKPGTLILQKTGGQVTVTFAPSTPGSYEIHLATLGGGIETKVRAGENAGRTLRHDFVALTLQTATPGDSATFTLPAPAKNPPPDLALAAWVTRRGELQPIQAVGGMLPKSPPAR
ncbi:MAG: DUF1223 domain-containing protein [Chthoniobacterales bacterium]